MLYRIHQFIKSIFPRVDSSEIKWALDNLSPEARLLFLKQSRSDQRHAIDVAQSLLKTKNTLSLTNFQNLLTAALLHDCGKSKVSNHLWHRVFIVLMQKASPSLRSRLEKSHTFLAIPLRTASQHAVWGSDLAQRAGLNPEICLLIYEHHNPTTELGRLLKIADNAH